MSEPKLLKADNQKIREFLLNFSLYIVLGAMIVTIILMDTSFLDVKNFINILAQASTRIIMACGAAGLIVLGGTDLSSGRVLGLTALISASLLQSVTYASRMYPDLPQLPIIVPLLVVVVVGAIFGLINGFGVAVLKVHAFIITLGTQLIAYGIAAIYMENQPTGAQPIANFDDRYRNLVNGTINLSDDIKIPYLIFYATAVCIVMWIIWNKTRLGKNMFAIGGNIEAAEVSGVNIVKNIMTVFLIAGMLYGLAGFLEAGRIGSATSSTGLNYDLDAISAAVIGGVSFSGGVGTIPGVIIGAIILQFINYGLVYVGVNPYIQYIIKGLIIILAVSIDVRKYIKRK
ncbi:MAG: galactose/methyl galactoside ABC transporter permease MglC [Aerococcaceae bacterium]|nr:galactose/methyl galactoside ABC transporter permease MglC [Aerococcaceae bacterium]